MSLSSSFFVSFCSLVFVCFSSFFALLSAFLFCFFAILLFFFVLSIELIVTKKSDVEFQVRDSGIGISKEDIKKIIQPFYQADQKVSAKGFGLGLTICKKIIESHKGRLTIQSLQGKGSVFTLHLPEI